MNGYSLIVLIAAVIAGIFVVKATYVQENYKPYKPQKPDLSRVPGSPGIDYPIYHKIPYTKFSCSNVPAVPGMYADIETGCQVFHVCNNGRDSKILCPNGTIFHQQKFCCDWWYNVKCADCLSYYYLNTDPEHNPFTPKEPYVEKEDHYVPEEY